MPRIHPQSYEDTVLDDFLQRNNIRKRSELYSRKVNDIAIFKVYSLVPSGFVIISTSSYLPPVIGYSFSNDFVVGKTFPSEFEMFLSGYDRVYLNNQKNNVKRKTITSYPIDGFRIPIIKNTPTPLLSTTWGQRFPYNNKLPVGTATGCVPTSITQIMHYYQYPKKGLENIPAYEDQSGHSYDEQEIVNHEYKWNIMFDHYHGGVSEEQISEVANLMKHVGHAFKSNYGNETRTLSDEVPEAMIKYFDYDSDITLSFMYHPEIPENIYLEKDYHYLTQYELNQGRPLKIGGSGHSFVCDAFNSEDEYYHFNFGFEGLWDGYYTLLSPGSYSYQIVISNIKPRDEKTLEIIKPIQGQRTVNQGESVHYSSQVKNISSSTFSGYVSLAFGDIFNSVLTTHSPQKISNLQPGGIADVQFNFSVEEDATLNTRHIFLVEKGERNKHGEAKINSISNDVNNHIPITVQRKNDTSIILSHSLNNIGNVQKDTPFTYDVIISNESFIPNIKVSVVFIDINKNITHSLGSMEFNNIPPSNQKAIKINCLVPDDAMISNIYTMSIAFTTTQTPFINGYNLIVGENESIDTTTDVNVLGNISEYQGIVLNDDFNTPEIFSARLPFKIPVEIKSINRDMIADIIAILVDDDEKAWVISSSKSIQFEQGLQYNFDLDCAIDRNFHYGNYTLALAIQRPENGYNIEYLGVSEETIINKRPIRVEPTLESTYIRHCHSISPPVTAKVGEEFVLDVSIILEKHEPAVGYLGNLYAYLENDNVSHEIGELIYAYTTQGQPCDPWAIPCSISSDIVSGEYFIIVKASDKNWPEFISVITGLDESIVYKAKITID